MTRLPEAEAALAARWVCCQGLVHHLKQLLHARICAQVFASLDEELVLALIAPSARKQQCMPPGSGNSERSQCSQVK